MKTKIIKLAEIVIDAGTQQREKINDDVVAEYADAITCGLKFPAVTTFFNGAEHILVDGFHRYWAHKHLGILEIETDIHEGSKREAILFSAGVNGAHGIRPTNADKRKSVLLLLNDEEWAQWSDHQIAKHCKVTQPFVSKIRKEVITVISEENKSLNNNEEKNGLITVITPRDDRVNDTDKEDSEFDPNEYRLQELEETVKSLDEENTRLKDAIATNQIPDDIEIQSAEEIITDLRAQIKTLEATLASAETTRDTLYVKVRELEGQCKWYQSKLKKSGLAQ